MKKLFTIALLNLLAFHSFSQSKYKLSLNVSGRLVYNESNLLGLGMGVQTLYNNKTKFKPLLELSRDAFPSYKKLVVDSLGNPISLGVTRSTNILAGAFYTFSEAAFVSLSAGVGFENKRAYPSINLAAGTYLFNKQRCLLTLAYLHVFDKSKLKYQFSTLSLCLAVRVF